MGREIGPVLRHSENCQSVSRQGLSELKQWLLVDATSASMTPTSQARLWADRPKSVRRTPQTSQIKLEDLIFARDPQSAGLTTAANTSHTDYSAPVRDAPQAPTSPKTSMPNCACSFRTSEFHRRYGSDSLGIRKALKVHSNTDGFDAFRIMTSGSGEKSLVARSAHRRQTVSPAEVVRSRSQFCTYAIGKILRENPDIRLHRLILCGTIFYPNFHWDQIQHNVETPVCNNCRSRTFGRF